MAHSCYSPSIREVEKGRSLGLAHHLATSLVSCWPMKDPFSRIRWMAPKMWQLRLSSGLYKHAQKHSHKHPNTDMGTHTYTCTPAHTNSYKTNNFTNGLTMNQGKQTWRQKQDSWGWQNSRQRESIKNSHSSLLPGSEGLTVHQTLDPDGWGHFTGTHQQLWHGDIELLLEKYFNIIGFKFPPFFGFFG